MPSTAPKLVPSQVEDVAIALRAKLVQVASGAGWDGISVTTGTRNDPTSTMRIAYLAHQGNVRVDVDTAQAYLEWLQAGNMGTIFKWAKSVGRRL